VSALRQALAWRRPPKIHSYLACREPAGGGALQPPTHFPIFNNVVIIIIYHQLIRQKFGCVWLIAIIATLATINIIFNPDQPLVAK
jgi:hypothetical protein